MASPERAQFGDSLAARIALAVGATLVCLVLLELLARGFEAVSPPDPAELERHRAKRATIPPPEPGAFRIFVYGGSTVWGAPVPALSFVRQLEFWLARLSPDRPVQIVNFGVNGRPSAYVRAEVERSIGERPDLLIVLTAHNEFLDWEPDGIWEQRRKWLSRVIDRTALVRSLRRAGRVFEDSETPSLRPPVWVEPEDREGERFRERVAAYRRNTRAIVERAKAADVPLILATGPANLADWPPVYRFTHDPAFGRRVEALRARISRGELADAEAALAGLRDDYPGDAMLTFLTGRIAAVRGDVARAAALFDAARDADPVPWRVLGGLNDHVRGLAEEQGVLLADLDRAFRREAPDGLVGFEQVADNCHPTPLGSALVVRELLGVMAAQGLLLRDLQRLPALARQYAMARDHVLRAQPELWREYLLTNAVYVMKRPFFFFDAARMYLTRARAVAPSDWRVAANLATVAVLEGRLDEGRAQLERAAALHGRPLRFGDRGPTPYLREAGAILSGELTAFAPRDRADRE